jgi:hypothetical protein
MAELVLSLDIEATISLEQGVYSIIKMETIDNDIRDNNGSSVLTL